MSGRRNDPGAKTPEKISVGDRPAAELSPYRSRTPIRAPVQCSLRIARPVTNLALTQTIYCRGLGLQVVGRFENHAGFDSVMLGTEGADYHFEFTLCRSHPIAPAPTAEDLTVFYIPSSAEWDAACANMVSAGFKHVASFNPYWETRGRTYEDPDGYRIVLQNAEWSSVKAS